MSLHATISDMKEYGRSGSRNVTSGRSRSAKTLVGTATSTSWLHWASLNSTPHRASPSEEQALPAVFQAATPSADFNYSCLAIAINRRPVISRAPPQALHNASCVFTERVNKSAYHLQPNINCGYPHKLVTPT
jgi:hypothetical protein